MDRRPSITIKTSDFAFTNNELSFIKKHIHGKYPAVMGRVIDQTRLLMRKIQDLAKNNVKLVYYASRTHPDDSNRYVVSEMLCDIDDAGHRAIISIEPIEEKTKEHYDPKVVQKTIQKIQSFLTNPTHSPKGVRLVSCGSIPHRQVLTALNEYFEAVRQEVVVRSCTYSLDGEEPPQVFFEIRHKSTLSHYVRIQFDFFEFVPSAKTQDDSLPEGETQEQTPTEETPSE